MSRVIELIRAAGNGTLEFGDYTLAEKAKKEDFPFNGDLFKVKTYAEITKLEKNGMFAYESVPGTAVHDFSEDENGVSFTVEGNDEAQITLGLAEDTEYDVTVDGKGPERVKSNLGGKITLEVPLSMDKGAVRVTVKKA